MSFEEKSTWIYAVATVIVPGVYFATIFGQVQSIAVSEIAYQEAMLRTAGIAIALLIVVHIAIAIAAPNEADKSDQRDKEINRYGEYVGSFVLYGGGLVALGLALAEFEYFWIANAIFSTFVLAGLTTTAVKIVAYRRGF